MRKKALMEAEKRDTDCVKGYINPSYVLAGSRTPFEETAKFKKTVSGRKYISDAAMNKAGRS